MRAHVLVFILLLAPLAGCAERDAELGTAAVATPSAAAPANLPLPAVTNLTSADAPEWRVGDAWSVESEAGKSTLVVTQADAAGYILGTDNEELAGYDAMFDVSYLGRIRASDLAGSQGGAPVQFFAFPLEDGKKWSTTWDGRTIDLTATYDAAIPTSEGAQPGFVIAGMDGETPYVRYNYVPALRWWSEVAFDGFSMKVQKVARNWTGTLAEATATVVFEGATSGPVLAPMSGAFTVDEGQSFLMLALMGHAPMHARALAITDPSGQPYMTQTENFEASPNPGAMFVTERMPATPGEWHIVSPVMHHPEGGYALVVHQVAVTTKPFA